ncbi:MAG: hypothetical protein QM752_03705 [Gammaproteobacteria bacterium]
MLEFKELRKFSEQGPIDKLRSPYILCNEVDQANTLQRITDSLSATELPKKDALHIGFSVWFNLDLLAVKPTDVAIILDIDPNVQRIYQKLQDAFKSAETPTEFVKKFSSTFEENDPLLQFPAADQDKLLNKKLTQGYGFLASTASYAQVKRLVTEGRIFFGRADLTDSEDMQALANWCEKHALKTSTLYLSNIPEWIVRNSPQTTWDKMFKNLKPLIQEETQVIDAYFTDQRKEKEYSGPPLRITQGELPQYSLAKPKVEKLESKSRKPRKKKSLLAIFNELNVPPPIESSTPKKSLSSDLADLTTGPTTEEPACAFFSAPKKPPFAPKTLKPKNRATRVKKPQNPRSLSFT